MWEVGGIDLPQGTRHQGKYKVNHVEVLEDRCGIFFWFRHAWFWRDLLSHSKDIRLLPEFSEFRSEFWSVINNSDGILMRISFNYRETVNGYWSKIPSKQGNEKLTAAYGYDML